MPPRAEVLLERIELGRHIRANLRRLQALLSSHPGLREKALLAVRAEIARLRKNGLSPADRRAIRRLQIVRRTLERPEGSSAAPFVATSPALRAEGTFAASRSAIFTRTGPADESGGLLPGPHEGSVGAYVGRLPRPGSEGGLPNGLAVLLLPALLLTMVLLVRRVVREG